MDRRGQDANLKHAAVAKGGSSTFARCSSDIADRVIERFSNPGDTWVYDPFRRSASVPYRAILKAEKALACELSTSIFHGWRPTICRPPTKCPSISSTQVEQAGLMAAFTGYRHGKSKSPRKQYAPKQKLGREQANKLIYSTIFRASITADQRRANPWR